MIRNSFRRRWCTGGTGSRSPDAVVNDANALNDQKLEESAASVVTLPAPVAGQDLEGG